MNEHRQYKRGDRVEFFESCYSTDGRCLAKAGDIGTVLYDQDSDFVSVKLDRKHYPVNYTPANIVRLSESQ